MSHVVGFLLDPFRTMSSLTKDITGKSFENFVGGSGWFNPKDTVAPAATVTSPTVDATAGTTDPNAQLGRAALVSPGSQGVSGLDPTFRYKLLGN